MKITKSKLPPGTLVKDGNNRSIYSYLSSCSNVVNSSKYKGTSDEMFGLSFSNQIVYHTDLSDLNRYKIISYEEFEKLISVSSDFIIETYPIF